MPVYEVNEGKLTAANPTRFDVEGLRERQDIQRMLRDQIAVLGEDLFVLSDEYGGWIDSNRRIDLLCLDPEANLVVVELKRDDAGHMELQAIRYAAMIARMTFAEAVEAHAQYLRRCGQSGDDAEAALLAFLNWQEAEQEEFGGGVRIILASAAFSKELTTTVLWLREQGLDISCIRLSPYKLGDGRLLLDVQPIIPLPEATQFQTQIGLKRQAEQKAKVERHDLRQQFWAMLLDRAKNQTDLYLHHTAPSVNYMQLRIGRSGYHFDFNLNQSQIRAYLYIAGDEAGYEQLEAQKPEIEEDFGGPLEWTASSGRLSRSIGITHAGGYRSEIGEWPRIQDEIVSAMLRLISALRAKVMATSR
ncbi:DUF4268 domain-containing protein [Sphingomonas sp. BK580]|uniref:DUF4268 domain-containing protein n=1 Tax=Sphingomonas sp. BK580 TaxID=2586972 RepID=UPI001608E6DF|nr:DUF4268 domain-containing protein [Sphingomonas sp. BK580]MBB3695829.1 hypothetical protein [Sphingomonas sp. BK580]